MRLCSAQLMNRLVDPILADIEKECDEAIRDGGVWRSRRILVSGYVGLAKAMLLYAVEVSLGVFFNQDDCHAGLLRA